MSANIHLLGNLGQGAAIKKPSIEGFDDGDHTRRIGSLLVESGAITIEQAARVLELQREKGELFGEVAVRLGICSAAQVANSLSLQQRQPTRIQAQSTELAPHLSKILADPLLSNQFNRGVTHLELRWFNNSIERRCLSFVGSSPDEGCSTTVAAIAIQLAQTDRKVLVIDTDVHSPSQATLFGLKHSFPSLEDALSHPSSCREAPSPIQNIDLQVLAPKSMDPSQLQGKPFAQLLDYAASVFDMVLIDTPPTSLRPDAYTIAMRSSGAVAVVRLHKSREASTRRLVNTLMQSSVEVVGTIGTNF